MYIYQKGPKLTNQNFQIYNNKAQAKLDRATKKKKD